jgi:DNA-binding transcriptional MerR regulator
MMQDEQLSLSHDEIQNELELIKDEAKNAQNDRNTKAQKNEALKSIAKRARRILPCMNNYDATELINQLSQCLEGAGFSSEEIRRALYDPIETKQKSREIRKKYTFDPRDPQAPVAELEKRRQELDAQYVEDIINLEDAIVRVAANSHEANAINELLALYHNNLQASQYVNRGLRRSPAPKSPKKNESDDEVPKKSLFKKPAAKKSEKKAAKSESDDEDQPAPKTPPKKGGKKPGKK